MSEFVENAPSYSNGVCVFFDAFFVGCNTTCANDFGVLWCKYDNFGDDVFAKVAQEASK